jgi:hypothetical protein
VFLTSEYLKISEKLIFETAQFWINFWKKETNEETCFVCYYIDGKGHPIYFQTFQGHADIGKHALNMVTKLNKMLDNPSSHLQVNHIIVFDAGGNGVQTLRGFNDSDEYYITILDENQTKNRKFKHKQLETQYKYGNAKLIDCQIELIDSDEKNYIFESRAVIVNWDNGRKAVIITDIPPELLDESEVVKKYFDRWPLQEKIFREEKKLKAPLMEINAIEAQLTDLYQQEKMLREKSKIEEGNRILDDIDAICLKEYESNINRNIRQIAKIEKEHKDAFDKLKKNLEEEKRIFVVRIKCIESILNLIRS